VHPNGENETVNSLISAHQVECAIEQARDFTRIRGMSLGGHDHHIGIPQNTRDAIINAAHQDLVNPKELRDVMRGIFDFHELLYFRESFGQVQRFLSLTLSPDVKKRFRLKDLARFADCESIALDGVAAEDTLAQQDVFDVADHFGTQRADHVDLVGQFSQVCQHCRRDFVQTHFGRIKKFHPGLAYANSVLPDESRQLERAKERLFSVRLYRAATLAGDVVARPSAAIFSHPS
jgi:hypothetical protein